MPVEKLFISRGLQAVRLPKGFRFKGNEVSIRRKGAALILEPVKKAKAKWPIGFFESFRISKSGLERPPQGEMPPAPSFD